MTSDQILASLRYTAAELGADVATLAERVLTYPGFTTWTGSIENRHHYGEGGLLKHTYEVIQLCEVNRKEIERITRHKLDARVLFLAALTHDWGKTKDYAPFPPWRTNVDWQATPHHRRIHHITRSALLWAQAVAETGLCRDIVDEVTHCILAHHGSPARGSPVLPQTREAWVLHAADMTSCWMDACGRVEPKA